MAISVVELYRDFLPKTNCGDCGYPSCIAFATVVITEKYPVEKCIHLGNETIDRVRNELKAQYASGKFVKKDNAEEALQWARARATSMKIEELPERIGGGIIADSGQPVLELPYFNENIFITGNGIKKSDGSPLTRLEQVFIYNHIARGGRRYPTGNWKGFQEFPNTVSKIKSMVSHVEKPIEERYNGKTAELKMEAERIGARDITAEVETSDLSLEFYPLPRVPVRLIFRDGIKEDGLSADVKLLFDETAVEHLDIESIMFLSERIRQLLCNEND